MKKLFRLLASLKLAVLVIASLALALATATFIESLYDTRTAQYWIYKSLWFEGLLFLLGINILFVALSRLPWKPRHAPFLLAHLGILILLTGSVLTQKLGLDGSMRVSEGETTSQIELDQMGLVIVDGGALRRLPIPWIPPEREFRKISLRDEGYPFDLAVDKYITHAEPDYRFVSDPVADADSSSRPAAKLRLQGGMMAIQQDFWIWGGDPSWASAQAGPAVLILADSKTPARAPDGRPSLILMPESGGDLRYLATSSDGKKVSGKLLSSKIKGFVLDPQWRGGVKIVFEDWVPYAISRPTYAPSRVQKGQDAPPSAIHLVSGNGGEGSGIWLGMGDHTTFQVNGKRLEVGYIPEMVSLPFQLKLDRFRIDHYQGTNNPSEYSSVVTVLDGNRVKQDVISMNEPLHHGGVTFYQASYEDGMPRPITSIFSVNRDPGRIWKYLGSILIVLGSILLFAMKYTGNKRATLKKGVNQ